MLRRLCQVAPLSSYAKLVGMPPHSRRNNGLGSGARRSETVRQFETMRQFGMSSGPLFFSCILNLSRSVSPFRVGFLKLFRGAHPADGWVLRQFEQNSAWFDFSWSCSQFVSYGFAGRGGPAGNRSSDTHRIGHAFLRVKLDGSPSPYLCPGEGSQGCEAGMTHLWPYHNELLRMSSPGHTIGKESTGVHDTIAIAAHSTSVMRTLIRLEGVCPVKE